MSHGEPLLFTILNHYDWRTFQLVPSSSAKFTAIPGTDLRVTQGSEVHGETGQEVPQNMEPGLSRGGPGWAGLGRWAVATPATDELIRNSLLLLVLNWVC